MQDPSNPEVPTAPNPGLTRRNVLGVAAAFAATPLFAAPAQAGQGLTRAARSVSGPMPAPVLPVVADLRATRARVRYLHASVGMSDGRVVVIGGYGVNAATLSRNASAPTASVQVYDPRDDAWTDLAPLLLPRARHAAVVLPDGRIAVLGGVHVNPVASVEIYDPQADAWTEGEPLLAPMADHAVSVCAAGLLVTGGQDGIRSLLLPFPA